MSVNIEVTHCRDCPRLKTEFVRSADGWGHGQDWFCTGIEGKDTRLITGFVEWPSEEPKEIPEWCPYTKKEG